MASTTTTTTTVALLLTVIMAISAMSATARPCRTIFFITSTTSYFPNPNSPFLNPNPNPNPRLTFFVTEIHHFHRSRPIFIPHDIVSDKPYYSLPHDVVSDKPYYSSSIRDRTMDIISIVGALLFGVGCGALTAGTMYLIWSLFSNRRFDFASDSEEEDSDDDVSPRNNGYVAVAAKEVPPSADEVDAMK